VTRTVVPGSARARSFPFRNARRLGRTPGTTEPFNVHLLDQNIGNQLLGHGFGGRPVNTLAMIDLTTLATTLLANFCTVRFPRYRPVWNVLDDEDLAPDARNRCLGHALRCEELLIRCHRFILRQGLAEAGHHRFLDRLEADPAGGWRIHLFLLDRDGIPLLVSITDGAVGPGDPVRFDPKAFVERRLQRLKKSHRIMSRYPWCEDNSA
jgi:hypothetical protein